ncbi:hypothetical protein CISG_05384 [Coccidioides immitis RMSCC 3703]|uniref:Uncharacterized protein n=2 Tax=Coccidioides immitis TaxID=5501 RepID=A0A0J8QST5_COCIT|nr:hypothetical protein CIRG_00723 [Coccidioides immitis RMSCC 2394]KMU75899.1 hypothetical protein CISG_05384 [Coccidioides immitis RMSCC 3703]
MVDDTKIITEYSVHSVTNRDVYHAESLHHCAEDTLYTTKVRILEMRERSPGGYKTIFDLPIRSRSENIHMARDVGQDGGEATPVHLAHPSRNPLPACGLYRFWARVNGAPRHGKTGLYGARSIITYTPRTSR